MAAYPESHPQAPNLDRDVENFARKMKAGANLAITQYFFTADAYFHFVDKARALGVTQPIIPGIMPITNYTKLARFSDACGADKGTVMIVSRLLNLEAMWSRAFANAFLMVVHQACIFIR